MNEPRIADEPVMLWLRRFPRRFEYLMLRGMHRFVMRQHKAIDVPGGTPVCANHWRGAQPWPCKVVRDQVESWDETRSRLPEWAFTFRVVWRLPPSS